MNAPDKTPESRSDQTPSSNFLKSLSSGVSLWSLFLFTGGLVFAVYYARIGYLPDIELNSALSYLAAASIIGGSLIVLLTLLIVVPGFIWATYLTRESAVTPAFCEDKKIIPKKFFFGLVVWLFLSASLMHLVLILHYRWLFWLFAVIALVKGSLIRFVEIKDCGVRRTKERNELFFVYGFWYAVSIGSVLAAIYVLFKFVDLSHATYVWTHFILCTLGVVVANSVVAVLLHQERKRRAYALAMFFALAIVVATDCLDHVPDKILANYGFGLAHVQIVVNDDGFKTLKSQGLVAVDVPNPGATAISDVSILCRMGQNYFLKINNRKVTLRKSDVLSWSVEDNH